MTLRGIGYRQIQFKSNNLEILKLALLWVAINFTISTASKTHECQVLMWGSSSVIISLPSLTMPLLSRTDLHFKFGMLDPNMSSVSFSACRIIGQFDSIGLSSTLSTAVVVRLKEYYESRAMVASLICRWVYFDLLPVIVSVEVFLRMITPLL